MLDIHWRLSPRSKWLGEKTWKGRKFLDENEMAGILLMTYEGVRDWRKRAGISTVGPGKFCLEEFLRCLLLERNEQALCRIGWQPSVLLATRDDLLRQAVQAGTRPLKLWWCEKAWPEAKLLLERKAPSSMVLDSTCYDDVLPLQTLAAFARQNCPWTRLHLLGQRLALDESLFDHVLSTVNAELLVEKILERT